MSVHLHRIVPVNSTSSPTAKANIVSNAIVSSTTEQVNYNWLVYGVIGILLAYVMYRYYRYATRTTFARLEAADFEEEDDEDLFPLLEQVSQSVCTGPLPVLYTIITSIISSVTLIIYC